MSATVLRPRLGKVWVDEARAKIHRLSDGRRLVIRPVGVSLHPAGCIEATRLDLVTCRFDFAGRSEIAVVMLQRVAMVALLAALREGPREIVVGYGGTAATASYRTCALQAELYARYQAGIGGKAAPPGESYHDRALSADAPSTEKGHELMREHGFYDGVSGDPSHFTYGVFG